MTTIDSEPVCYAWMGAWPHAVPDIKEIRSTEVAADVTCPACRWAMGSQKHPFNG